MLTIVVVFSWYNFFVICLRFVILVYVRAMCIRVHGLAKIIQNG